MTRNGRIVWTLQQNYLKKRGGCESPLLKNHWAFCSWGSSNHKVWPHFYSTSRWVPSSSWIWFPWFLSRIICRLSPWMPSSKLMFFLSATFFEVVWLWHSFAITFARSLRSWVLASLLLLATLSSSPSGSDSEAESMVTNCKNGLCKVYESLRHCLLKG